MPAAVATIGLPDPVQACGQMMDAVPRPAWNVSEPDMAAIVRGDRMYGLTNSLTPPD
jgi:hypothetical protein